jgi:ligand-binding SRPBCC domain-containing protein
MAVYQFKTEQKIPASLDKVWDFISTPRNLSKITPSYMGFEITNEPISDKMYPGMIIMYKVSPLFGIKMTWVTEITHVVEKKFFVDEQRVGPYAIWHHQHKVSELSRGILMEDIVTYAPPLGIIGVLANDLMIKGKLKEIFDFRYQAVEKEFGKY